MQFCQVRVAEARDPANKSLPSGMTKYKGHIQHADYPPFASLSDTRPWMVDSHPHDCNSLSPGRFPISNKWAFSGFGLSKRLLFQKLVWAFVMGNYRRRRGTDRDDSGGQQDDDEHDDEDDHHDDHDHLDVLPPVGASHFPSRLR
ncbi:hypothetical protein FQN60_017538 [Etheostoma spectabile]|uniref:Uncharacterized protein n=1 Tax=Etheostoma spectabile TaxID=54343 RepID=A0A5J5CF35_9PERO|nr:hypothetical protein FQN60_018657 [Etheostoma spectabile]KAA8592083.1 hypothetical protein FQN60_017538 [Etheostoma spectabile]